MISFNDACVHAIRRKPVGNGDVAVVAEGAFFTRQAGAGV
jgi:hypothetical protein